MASKDAVSTATSRWPFQLSEPGDCTNLCRRVQMKELVRFLSVTALLDIRPDRSRLDLEIVVHNFSASNGNATGTL